MKRGPSVFVPALAFVACAILGPTFIALGLGAGAAILWTAEPFSLWIGVLILGFTGAPLMSGILMCLDARDQWEEIQAARFWRRLRAQSVARLRRPRV